MSDLTGSLKTLDQHLNVIVSDCVHECKSSLSTLVTTRLCGLRWCEKEEDKWHDAKLKENSTGRSEGVPASWPRCWHGPETSYASYSLACSSLDGKGPSALYSPHCTFSEKSIRWDFNLPQKSRITTQVVTCLFAQTTEQNLLEPLNV